MWDPHEPDRVRAAFLVAWVGGEIVDRASFRFGLSQYLSEAGGHIGYAVNVGSRLVIERCGGTFDGVVHDAKEKVDKRRYWIR